MADKQKNFIPISGRDAYATIRGYVYQVDVTISWWLSLEKDEELQLECGEDIDRIQKQFMEGNAEILRALGQVRYRQRELRLKSAEALQALSSFTEHRANNPERRISFLYLTNAQVGREYGSPFPNGEAGIEVWQRIRRGELSGNKLSEALNGIRAILAGAAKPKKVGDSQWAAFQKLFTTTNERTLLEYIKLFEWSAKAPDSSQMPERIMNGLLQNGKAHSRHASRLLYERLFLFVISTTVL
jgi:hypothetical protein